MDWRRFARRSWERTPLHARGAGLPLATPEVFRSIVAACAPFRSGTLYYATPDVRFFDGHARLRAPGALLPGEGDASVDDYIARVTPRVGQDGFQLVVEHPLCLDFELWSQVRAWVRPLLEAIGYPVAPIVAELAIGTTAASPRGLTKRRDHALLTLVVAGRVGVKVWGKPWGDAANEATGFAEHAHEAEIFEAAPGDLLHVPSGAWSLEESHRAVVLRLWVPTANAAARAVKEPLLMAMAESIDETDVPYLPYPPRRRRAGDVDSLAPPMVAVARLLETLTRSADLEDTLRVLWAKRVSACGLEPVPGVRPGRRIGAGMVVRLSEACPIVRMDFEPPNALWAVNGHVFAVREDAATARLLASLREHRPRSVAELVPRRGPGSDAALQVLEALHVRRALDIVNASAARGAGEDVRA